MQNQRFVLHSLLTLITSFENQHQQSFALFTLNQVVHSYPHLHSYFTDVKLNSQPTPSLVSHLIIFKYAPTNCVPQQFSHLSFLS